MEKVLDYDEIGSLLLLHLPFREAEGMIAQLQELIASGVDPGAAFLDLLGTSDEHEQLRALEPIRGHIHAYQAGRAASPDPDLGQTQWHQTDHTLFAKSAVVSLEERMVLCDETTHYVVRAARCMPSLGPDTPGMTLIRRGAFQPTWRLSRADALALMEALAAGLMLMEKLK